MQPNGGAKQGRPKGAKTKKKSTVKPSMGKAKGKKKWTNDG